MKNVTWPQCVLVAVLLGAAVAAPHFAGANGSSVVNAACVLLAWLTNGPALTTKDPS